MLMNCDYSIIVRLYDIELDGAWGRGDQIYSNVWLTNESAGFKQLLTQLLSQGAGGLEFDRFVSSPVVVWAKAERAQISGHNEALALLTSYLYLIQSFLNVLWTVKDHAVNFELGFIQVTPTESGPYISSNLIGDAKSLSSGGIKQTRFTREEVRVARQRFSHGMTLVCPPEQFLSTNPFLEREHALAIASQKGSQRIERFFFFVGSARSQSDLGLKIAIYCTALESLFCTDPNELTHKVAERVACFLGKATGERVSIYQQIKKAYNIRSKVIHGDTLSEQAKSEIVTLSINLDEVLRVIARRLFESDLIRAVLESKNDIEPYLLSLVFSAPGEATAELVAQGFVDGVAKPS